MHDRDNYVLACELSIVEGKGTIGGRLITTAATAYSLLEETVRFDMQARSIKPDRVFTALNNMRARYSLIYADVSELQEWRRPVEFEDRNVELTSEQQAVAVVVLGVGGNIMAAWNSASRLCLRGNGARFCTFTYAWSATPSCVPAGFQPARCAHAL